MNSPRSRTSRSRRTYGVAAVELAICLPVIFLLVFASIESCSMIFVTQSLHAAGYEGARVAIRRNGTNAQAEQQVQRILDGHGIAGTTVRLEPANVATVNSGGLITVVVNASCDANRISPVFFFGARSIEVRTTMAKE